MVLAIQAKLKEVVLLCEKYNVARLAFFGLLADLEQLFKISIDLIEREPIDNPYFLKAIEQKQVVIYEAA